MCSASQLTTWFQGMGVGVAVMLIGPVLGAIFARWL
jgi:hypothetical protein